MKPILKTHFFLVSLFFSFLFSNAQQGPVLEWARTMGSGWSDEGNSIALDTNRNVYTTGFFGGTVDFDPGAGAYSLTAVGANDIYITKFDPNGNFIWARSMGGLGNDAGLSVATDLAGNVYVTGTFSNTIDMDPGAGTYTFTSYGNTDMFICKLDGSGNFILARQFGSTGEDRGCAITTDAAGNIFTTGAFQYTVDFDPGISTFTMTTGGFNNDIFISKLDAFANFVWAKQISPASGGQGSAIAVDASGNVSIAGWYWGIADFDPGTTTFTNTSNGNRDGFVCKLSSSGSYLWSAQMGWMMVDECTGIDVDANGNVYATGFWRGTADFDPGTAVHNLTTTSTSTCDDFFVWKLSSTGSLVWAKQFGGSLVDKSFGIDVDPAGNSYVTGFFMNIIQFASTVYYSHYMTTDVFIIKVDASGNCVWGRTFGGSTDDQGNSIAVDPIGKIHTTGFFGSTVDFNPNNGIDTLSSWGGRDIFVHKMGLCNIPPMPVNVTPSLNLSLCQGGTTTLSAIGTGTVEWYYSNTSPFPSAVGSNWVVGFLPPGTHWFYAANTTCLPSPPIIISVTVFPKPTVTVNSGSVCSGNTFTISPSGAANYTITGGTNVVSPATTTSYSVTGTSSLGCVSANTAIATVTVAQTPTITAANPTFCAGQSPTLSGTGAVSYSIIGAQPPSPQAMVRGFSAEGCISGPVLVTMFVMPLPVVTVSSGSICSGKSFTLTPSGANTYTISGGSSIVYPSVTTSYSVVGKSVDGCLSSNTAIATVSVSPSPVVSINSGSICPGGSVTLTPVGAASFVISGNSYMVSPPATTNYSLTGTSSDGCASINTAVATVVVHASPTIAVNSGTICAGQVFTINPSGASSYVFSAGSNTVSPAFSTNYSVTGVSSEGCISSNTAISSVTVLALPILTISGVSSVCSGGSASISAAGASQYLWSNFVNTYSLFVSPTVNTTYTVTGTDANGCQNTAVKSVTVNPNPVVSASASNGTICFGNSVTLNGAGALSYVWSGGAINNTPFFPASTAVYTVTGSDLNNCKGTSTIVILVNNLPQVHASASSTQVCSGNSVTVNGSGANTYSWSGGVINNTSFSPNTTATYTVTGTGQNGCTNAATVSIVVHPLPNVTVTASHSLLCKGESSTLTATGATSYSWSNGSTKTSISVSPNVSTTYTVTGTDHNGCFMSALVVQSIDACSGVNNLIEQNDVAFFPNPGSGVFYLRLPVALENASLEIFNAIGLKVHQSNVESELSEINLSECSNGVYVAQVIQNGKLLKRQKLVKQ